jgi:cell division control protein 6
MSSLSLGGATGVETLHFVPYDHQQLLSIVQTRLKPLTSLESPTSDVVVQQFLPASTLTFLSRKIAAQTGDVRSLFEVLRGAIDLAVPQPPADDKDTPPVTPAHILAALKAYTPTSKVVPATTPVKSSTSSETVGKVRNLGLHARLALLALVVASRRTETSLPPILSLGNSPRSPVKRSSSLPTPLPTTQGGIEVSQLHMFYSTILTRNETGTFSPVSRSEFTDLAGVLETVGLISLSTARNGRKMARTGSFPSRGTKGIAGAQQNRNVTLTEGIRHDEVLRGLGIGAETKDICEEEVEGIWKRELAQIRKEVRTQLPGANPADFGFDDATED